MSGTGRPKITLQVDKEMLEKIKKVQKWRKCSVTSAVRFIINEVCKDREGKE